MHLGGIAIVLCLKVSENRDLSDEKGHWLTKKFDDEGENRSASNPVRVAIFIGKSDGHKKPIVAIKI